MNLTKLIDLNFPENVVGERALHLFMVRDGGVLHACKDEKDIHFFYHNNEAKLNFLDTMRNNVALTVSLREGP